MLTGVIRHISPIPRMVSHARRNHNTAEGCFLSSVFSKTNCLANVYIYVKVLAIEFSFKSAFLLTLLPSPTPLTLIHSLTHSFSLSHTRARAEREGMGLHSFHTSFNIDVFSSSGIYLHQGPPTRPCFQDVLAVADNFFLCVTSILSAEKCQQNNSHCALASPQSKTITSHG